MKAFETHRYWVCSITGNVFLQASFEINRSPVVLEEFFENTTLANNYLSKEKRGWLLIVLENYVLHKKKIIDNNNDAEAAKSLTVCLNALDAYEKKETTEVCKLFLRGIKYFENILPNPNNDSYESSINNLNELKKFCELETKQLHGEKEIRS